MLPSKLSLCTLETLHTSVIPFTPAHFLGALPTRIPGDSIFMLFYSCTVFHFMDGLHLLNFLLLTNIQVVFSFFFCLYVATSSLVSRSQLVGREMLGISKFPHSPPLCLPEPRSKAYWTGTPLHQQILLPQERAPHSPCPKAPIAPRPRKK